MIAHGQPERPVGDGEPFIGENRCAEHCPNDRREQNKCSSQLAKASRSDDIGRLLSGTKNAWMHIYSQSL